MVCWIWSQDGWRCILNNVVMDVLCLLTLWWSWVSSFPVLRWKPLLVCLNTSCLCLFPACFLCSPVFHLLINLCVIKSALCVCSSGPALAPCVSCVPAFVPPWLSLFVLRLLFHSVVFFYWILVAWFRCIFLGTPAFFHRACQYPVSPFTSPLRNFNEAACWVKKSTSNFHLYLPKFSPLFSKCWDCH